MKSNPKSDCIAVLKQRILSMEIAPGQLLDETALSQEFGISRTPLREVIQRLVGEGYLSSQENRGAKVASMDISTMRHFFQAAPMIYASIARLAAEHADNTQVEALRFIQQDYRQSISDGLPRETAMHNFRFHKLIGEMAGTPYLLPSLDRLLIDHTRIGQVFYQTKSPADHQRIDKAADQHDQMIDAFARNAAAEAVQLTLEHWELSRHQMEQFVTPDPLPFELADEARESRNAV
ncbi:MAG: GntR family transcriptional regulator [Rhizobiaceae bacterium]